MKRVFCEFIATVGALEWLLCKFLVIVGTGESCSGMLFEVLELLLVSDSSSPSSVTTSGADSVGLEQGSWTAEGLKNLSIFSDKYLPQSAPLPKWERVGT